MGLGPQHWKAATWCRVRAPHPVLDTHVGYPRKDSHVPAWSDLNFPQPQPQDTHGPCLILCGEGSVLLRPWEKATGIQLEGL